MRSCALTFAAFFTISSQERDEAFPLTVREPGMRAQLFVGLEARGVGPLRDGAFRIPAPETYGRTNRGVAPKEDEWRLHGSLRSTA
jgi:hypothetical protein